ncbi:MAG: ribosome small subunit-dependent GTPase A, partial [Flavobacterium sp.]|nr:ribosome small subunit-dependent GTPase A [Flavobacterium sp.]
MENLKVLGFNKWFEHKKDYNMLISYKLARVIIVNKNNYVVSDGKREINAGLTGKFMFNSESALDYPAVGDWVYIQLFDDDTLAVIHEIFPRKSVLKRKTSGKNIDYQLIAANIDTAIIMQALDNNFNLRRLERYMVMVNESGIKPVLLLSKTDLLEQQEIDNR